MSKLLAIILGIMLITGGYLLYLVECRYTTRNAQPPILMSRLTNALVYAGIAAIIGGLWLL